MASRNYVEKCLSTAGHSGGKYVGWVFFQGSGIWRVRSGQEKRNGEQLWGKWTKLHLDRTSRISELNTQRTQTEHTTSRHAYKNSQHP